MGEDINWLYEGGSTGSRPRRSIEFEASNCEASHFCEASQSYSHSHWHFLSNFAKNRTRIGIFCQTSPKIALKLYPGLFDSHSTRHDKVHFAEV